MNALEASQTCIEVVVTTRAVHDTDEAFKKGLVEDPIEEEDLNSKQVNNQLLVVLPVVEKKVHVY